MHKFLIFVLVAMMAVAVFSAPADDQDMVRMDDGSVRMQRITCDLLSGLGVGDSACAAHCLLLGFRGGWCERGVCHCRW